MVRIVSVSSAILDFSVYKFILVVLLGLSRLVQLLFRRHHSRSLVTLHVRGIRQCLRLLSESYYILLPQKNIVNVVNNLLCSLQLISVPNVAHLLSPRSLLKNYLSSLLVSQLVSLFSLFSLCR
jgi:hypothetical protein